MTDYNDPFADEAQTQPTNNAPADNHWEDTPVTNAPAASTVVVPAPEGKVVVTLKGGKEFDKPWIVIHANDAEDALSQLNEKAMGELIKRTRAVADFFTGGGAGASGAPQQRQGGGQQGTPAGKPQGATEPPADVEPRFCKHGEMVFRTGFSEAKQKTWKGFFCPTPKGTADQCKAQFLR